MINIKNKFIALLFYFHILNDIMITLNLVVGVVYMSSFILKIIALISMLFDHSGYLIFGKFSWFNYIGRLAFPIFAFQISEGYVHTKNLQKYAMKLLIFALISQIPFMLFRSFFASGFVLNIFFTLFIGLLAIWSYDKAPNKFVGITISILLAFIANYLKMDYGAFGIAIILLFYIFKQSKLLSSISFILSLIVYYLPKMFKSDFYYPYYILFICSAITLIPILLYNGKKGKNTKYLLYFFYPLHLLLLYYLSLVL